MARKAKEQVGDDSGRAVGRPTKYDPAYCHMVLDFGREGMSLVEMASALNVSRANLYDWAEQNPEFSACLTRAREESQAWWERVGRLGVFKGDHEIDSNLWFRNVTKRFRQDWGETKAPEVEAGDMLEVKPVAIDADKLEPEKRELLKELLMELKKIGESENA